MAVRANRILDRVLRALGADVVALQPNVGADQIALVSVIDQLQFASGNRASMKAWWTAIPSIAAAQFSCIEIQPLRGMWVREITNTGASPANMALRGGGLSALAAADNLALSPLVLSRPDGSDFAQRDTTVSQVIPPGTDGYPILANWQLGRTAAALTGIFFAGGGVIRFNDLWCPPMSVFAVTCPSANTTIAVALELEFPADVVFTP